jgi:hypothetical protein
MSNKEHDSHAVALAATQSMMTYTEKEEVGDNVKLKWGLKWRWFVVVSVERVLHNCFQQNMLEVDETGKVTPGPMIPKRRVTLFGSILQQYSDDVQKRHIYFGGRQRMQLNCLQPYQSTGSHPGKDHIKAKYDAKEGESVQANGGKSADKCEGQESNIRVPVADTSAGQTLDTEGRFVKVKMPSRRRNSMTMEFHAQKDEELTLTLQNVYDPQRQAVGHELYTQQNLLKRESVKWDTRVRKVLDGIWKAIDIDGSGGISKDEYDAMHEQMWYAAHELDKQRKAEEVEAEEVEEEEEVSGERKVVATCLKTRNILMDNKQILAKTGTAEEKTRRKTAETAQTAEERPAWRKQAKVKAAVQTKGQLACREASLQDDWKADSESHTHLNYQRFTKCWFEMVSGWSALYLVYHTHHSLTVLTTLTVLPYTRRIGLRIPWTRASMLCFWGRWRR